MQKPKSQAPQCGAWHGKIRYYLWSTEYMCLISSSTLVE